MDIHKHTHTRTHISKRTNGHVSEGINVHKEQSAVVASQWKGRGTRSANTDEGCGEATQTESYQSVTYITPA